MSAVTEPRFFARSASDRTDDWPHWYVADRAAAELNVTVQLLPALRGSMPFLPRQAAEELARLANERGGPAT